MKCTSAELYFNILVTWPEQLPSPQARRERPPDDDSLKALLKQLRREATQNGRAE